MRSFQEDQRKTISSRYEMNFHVGNKENHLLESRKSFKVARYKINTQKPTATRQPENTVANKSVFADIEGLQSGMNLI